MSEEGSEPPAGDAAFAPTSEELQELLYYGHLTRYLEERLHLMREVAGDAGGSPIHAPDLDPSCVPAALAMHRRTDGTGDVCAPNSVGLGAVLAFGGTPLEYFRQCLGRATSPTSGRTGGVEWTDRRRGLLSAGGIAGTMTQVMAGVALAFKHRGEPRVALCFEDPWAPQSGGWHEGINFAAAHRLPLVVVLYGRADVQEQGRPGPPFRESRGEAYGLKSDSVHAGNLSGIFSAVAEARARALAGKGVTLLQVESHDMPEGPWSSLDRLSRAAVQTGVLKQAELDRFLDQAVHEVDHAATRVEKEPAPHVREALVPVLSGAEPVPPWTRQDPPDPSSKDPLEPKGDLFVL